MYDEYPLYDGAGNLFRMVDGRSGAAIPPIESLCRFDGGCADGVIVLRAPDSPGADFRMEYFNADGSGGMMCGNGGRCIAAFARELGLDPGSADGRYRFEASDGLHEAEIVEDGPVDKRIRLSLREVTLFHRVAHPEGWFLDTGCRHFVTFVESEAALSALDLKTIGPSLRYHAAFAPEGVNVDFAVLRSDGSLAMRTYEKGVEAETRACGTGAVATAVAVAIGQHRPGANHFEVDVPGGRLQVDFLWDGHRATKVVLSGATHRH